MKAILITFTLFLTLPLVAQLTFTNNNPISTVVPFGGTFTYSVTYSNPKSVAPFLNGEISHNGTGIAAYANLPITYNTIVYPIMDVSGSNIGSYELNVYGVWSPQVYLYESPVIQIQPSNMVCTSGVATTMGMIAGPVTTMAGNVTKFQWFDAFTGISISAASNAPTFIPTLADDGELVYCQIMNPFGSITSSNVQLTVVSPPMVIPIATQIALSNQQVMMSWNIDSNDFYQVQWSSNLQSWSALTNLSFIVQSNGFYRLLEQ